MSLEDPQGPAEFKPVKLGPGRRRLDPLAIGVVVIVAALGLAILKPWDRAGAGVAVGPTPSPTATSQSPEPSALAPGALVPPTWEGVRSVITSHLAWGIRTIVLGATPDASPDASPAYAPDGSAVPDRYAERWFSADVDGGEDSTAIVDEREGPIVALGVTFPPQETPLDVRIWLDHADGDLEWIDARPVNEVPARGAYLFLRRSVAGAAVRSWAPGRYRMDVLVGGGIKRIDVLIRGTDGRLPIPEPWPREVPPAAGLDTLGLAGVPQGPFAQTDGSIVSLPASSGPVLDEAGAWLDLDRPGPGQAARSFVATTYQPHATQLGVVLPPYSTVQVAELHRIAPLGDTTDVIRLTAIGGLSPVSFVAFGPRGGAVWRPGVYALSVRWSDALGEHDLAWHIELRPGPLPAPPLLLAATRAWTTHAGSSGVLLGASTALDPTSATPGIRLVGIDPQAGTAYPGLGGSDLIGCGATHVQGRPEVIGIVGPVSADLTPVPSTILYPFADAGPLPVLTASGSVRGLTLVAPTVTAEFGGPASYGFRAGLGPDAPGYTICIGLVAG